MILKKEWWYKLQEDRRIMRKKWWDKLQKDGGYCRKHGGIKYRGWNDTVERMVV